LQNFQLNRNKIGRQAKYCMIITSPATITRFAMKFFTKRAGFSFYVFIPLSVSKNYIYTKQLHSLLSPIKHPSSRFDRDSIDVLTTTVDKTAFIVVVEKEMEISSRNQLEMILCEHSVYLFKVYLHYY
jgi:hypothetical protein